MLNAVGVLSYFTVKHYLALLSLHKGVSMGVKGSLVQLVTSALLVKTGMENANVCSAGLLQFII